VAGVFWIVGGFAQPSERLAWWAAALAIEFVSPAVYFWVPGLGRSRVTDWNVDGRHMAERCGLFVIIALGESLLVSGATPPESSHDGSMSEHYGGTMKPAGKGRLDRVIVKARRAAVERAQNYRKIQWPSFA